MTYREVIKMTRQLKKLTAEDLDCYTELLSGITRRFQQFSYRNLYLYDVQKTLRILNIYREWLLTQPDQDFGKLYEKFWGQSEMDITAVSLLLVPTEHDKKKEIERVNYLLNKIEQMGTSYLLNDVQTNAIGFTLKNKIYAANRDGLEEVFQNSQNENNIEYSSKLQDFLETHHELYPDADTLISFFDDGAEDEDLNTNE